MTEKSRQDTLDFAYQTALPEDCQATFCDGSRTNSASDDAVPKEIEGVRPKWNPSRSSYPSGARRTASATKNADPKSSPVSAKTIAMRIKKQDLRQASE
jgi:hypothetical protein